MTSITGLSPVASQNDVKDEEITFISGDLDKYYDMLSEMLVNVYSKEAPVTKAVGAKPDEIRESYLEICKESINSPYTILPFIGDKCIGWVLNYIKTDIEPCNEDPNLSFNNDFTERIFNNGQGNIKANRVSVVIQEIERNFAFFIPDCKKLFLLDVLFVLPAFGGKGIASKLTEKTIALARENHCDYIMSISTNIKSAHIFTKFGFKSVREIPFNAFHENGQPYLKDFGDGNNTARLMFLKLNEQ